MRIPTVILRFAPFAVLTILPMMVWLIYYPGLSGDFEFDDGINILDNKKLLLDSLDWASLKRSFFSGDSGPLGRPLSMLSFALNYYFSGFDPYYFKLVNVMLHAFNGVLLFLLARKIGLYLYPVKDRLFSVTWASLCLALLWSLAPINLTSVLYVVQRMTSLASGLVLLALYGYISFRIEEITVPGLAKKGRWLVMGLFAFVASLFSKESGILALGYAFALELTIFRFVCNHDGRLGRHWPLIGLYALLLIGCVGGIVWQLTNPDRLGFAAGYSLRDFSLEQRLLTQPRVLAFYVRQTLLPDIAQMGLYHDDFVISRSLMQPWSTWVAIGSLLLGLLFAAWALLNVPLLALPVLWFLAGHSLESSIFPLEMVHEHRNYLPSVGVFLLPVLAVFGAQRRAKLVWPAIIGITVLGLLQSVQTWIRADQWGSLIDHAAIEVHNHPESERANYQLGRMYFKLYGTYRRMDYYLAAKHYFEVASKLENGQNGGLFALIQLSYMARQPLNSAWIDSLTDRLEHRPPYTSNVPFLNALLNCQIGHYCKLTNHDVVRILEAALRNPRASRDNLASVHSMLGVYIVQKMGDGLAAEPHLLAAYRNKPLPDHALNVSSLYLMVNELDKAQFYINLAAQLDQLGYFEQEISRQRNLLMQGKVKRSIN